jgi:hypothetical protein
VDNATGLVDNISAGEATITAASTVSPIRFCTRGLAEVKRCRSRRREWACVGPGLRESHGPRERRQRLAECRSERHKEKRWLDIRPIGNPFFGRRRKSEQQIERSLFLVGDQIFPPPRSPDVTGGDQQAGGEWRRGNQARIRLDLP